MNDARHADRFPPLPEHRAATWAGFGSWQEEYFASLVGLEVEEIRTELDRLPAAAPEIPAAPAAGTSDAPPDAAPSPAPSPPPGEERPGTTGTGSAF